MRVASSCDLEYRYDLSRISDMDALTNVVIGAKLGTNQLGDVSWLLDGTNTVTSICDGEAPPPHRLRLIICNR